jgi:nucleotide-binding universal stress UspA family protein
MKSTLVVIASYKYSRALLLKGRLEAEGIESYLANVNLIQSDIASGVKVLIKKEDMPAALRIIKDISKEYKENVEPKKAALYKVHRILVPVDFSVHSLNACDYAAALADKLHAEIKLLHTYYNPTSVASAFPDAFSYELGMGNLGKDIEKSAKEEMILFKDRLNDRFKSMNIQHVKLTTTVLHGLPGDEIFEVGSKYKPQLIVIGTRGKDLKKNDLVGHVTAEIIESSDFPVFAVPKESTFKQFENSNLLYVTDFDDPDFSAFRKLMSIVSPFNMKIFCIHVGDEKNNPYDAFQMENLQKRISKIYGDFPVECHLIKSKDIVKGINGFVKDHAIDIIAMTSKKHNFIYRIFNQSNARKILFQTSVPLLVFPV